MFGEFDDWLLQATAIMSVSIVGILTSHLIEKANRQEFQQLHIIEKQKQEIEGQNQALEYAFAELEKKNKDQTASINYAKRIQNSMLPDLNMLSDIFPESYVYYKPRDIVSGDFYWFERMIHEGKDYFIIAAADCTGHGVPGAIMAMLGSNLLTNIICYGFFFEPAEILRRLNKDIQTELHQEKNESQDGMEIGLCTIDMDTMELTFCGGGRPLYLYRNEELMELKPAKMTIGGWSKFLLRKSKSIVLEDQTIQLESGDIFYMFSDGLKDQQGGENGKIFSRKRVKQLLFDIHKKGGEDQHKEIDETLNEWKRNYKQIDDILVMSIKVP